MRAALLSVVCVVCCSIGCSSDDDWFDSASPNKPRVDNTVVTPERVDFFEAIARSIGPARISNLDQLSRVVVIMGRNGDLSSEDVAKIQGQFSDWGHSDRALTSDDVAKIRSLK